MNGVGGRRHVRKWFRCGAPQALQTGGLLNLRRMGTRRSAVAQMGHFMAGRWPTTERKKII